MTNKDAAKQKSITNPPSLAAMLSSTTPFRAHQRPQILVWLDSLADADQRAVLQWVADGNSAPQLADMAIAAGCPIGRASFVQAVYQYLKPMIVRATQAETKAA